MFVRFIRPWHLPRANAGDVMYLKPDVALKLLKRGVVEAIPAKRETAVTVTPEKAIHE